MKLLPLVFIAAAACSAAFAAHSPLYRHPLIEIENGTCVQIVIGHRIGVQYCAHDNGEADLKPVDLPPFAVLPYDGNCTTVTFDANTSYASIVSCAVDDDDIIIRHVQN